MTRNIHIDEYIVFFHPTSKVFFFVSFSGFSFFFWRSYSLFQGLLHDIDTETLLHVLTEHWKRSNVFLPSLGPMFWACAFLEESLIHSRSQRLVSRRNIVPIL